MTLKVHLGGHPSDARPLDSEMYMRSPSWVRNRPNGSETEGAVLSGYSLTETLEIGIGTAASVPWVVIKTESVALPNLNPRSLNWSSVFIEDAAKYVGNLAGSGLLPAFDVDQVGIRVDRNYIRIKRPCSLPRCEN